MLIVRTFHNRNIVNGLIAIGLIGAIALGCTCGRRDFSNTGSSGDANTPKDIFGGPSSDDKMPGNELLNALVKETTADFAYSISIGDFSNMYDKASTDLQNTYTKDQMQNSFKDLIARKRQLLPILLKANSMEPEYSPAPSVRTESELDVLSVTGKYTTKPLPITFNYEYVKRNGDWKLVVLKVYVR